MWLLFSRRLLDVTRQQCAVEAEQALCSAKVVRIQQQVQEKQESISRMKEMIANISNNVGSIFQSATMLGSTVGAASGMPQTPQELQAMQNNQAKMASVNMCAQTFSSSLKSIMDQTALKFAENDLKALNNKEAHMKEKQAYLGSRAKYLADEKQQLEQASTAAAKEAAPKFGLARA